jgi:hypothetical protein
VACRKQYKVLGQENVALKAAQASMGRGLVLSASASGSRLCLGKEQQLAGKQYNGFFHRQHGSRQGQARQAIQGSSRPVFDALASLSSASATKKQLAGKGTKGCLARLPDCIALRQYTWSFVIQDKNGVLTAVGSASKTNMGMQDSRSAGLVAQR